MSLILLSSNAIELFEKRGGGKATHLARLSQAQFPVPSWFCLSVDALQRFIQENHWESEIKSSLESTDTPLPEVAARIEALFLSRSLSEDLNTQIQKTLQSEDLLESFVAVRSSGIGEDSAEYSFAGQFSSFLFQKGELAIEESIKRCWASGFSERALAYRRERDLSWMNIQVGVVIQKMVNAESAGVAFSRNPIRPLDREQLVISSVWGLGEGLVNGELDADNFEVSRRDFQTRSQIVEKNTCYQQAPQGGLMKVAVPPENVKKPSLSENQVRELAELVLTLENKIGSPQDCEWAYENQKLYLVQTRPITNIPRDVFFDSQVNGDLPIVWDNSNIIESYSGVTSPLTFSFASACYRQVYVQFCEVVGVPKKMIESNELMYRNMLGLLRGRIYYNLKNWYQLVLMLPGASNNQSFMNTMMGVRTDIAPQFAEKVHEAFAELQKPAAYSLPRRLWIGVRTVDRFFRIRSIVRDFQSQFNQSYQHYRQLPFEQMALTDLGRVFQELDTHVLRKWKAPIINDYLCMLFFGLLKKLTEKWIQPGETESASLQNDLLCGQGDLDSTEPTKMLMRIAEKIDQSSHFEVREWFVQTPPQAIWALFKDQQESREFYRDIAQDLHEFLDRYGYRCINELKLEEPDLHDDPAFVISAIAGYIKMKSYSIAAMEEREKAIRIQAEAIVKEKLGGFKRRIYFWVLKHAREAVKNRENLRFARTKIFGVARHLFRGMGSAMSRLDVLNASSDIFYLTIDEISAYIEGRSTLMNLRSLVALRKSEYEQFRKTPAPPDRLMTLGTVSLACAHPQVLADADLLQKPLGDLPLDPNLLVGNPCCPGVVEGIVRVVESVKDAEGLNGEILVTARTDPGWVPLFPSCSGLLVERGSLLSHSAVVARELGLPTIVGISGGMMKRLKTGQKVRIDAGRGEVRILG